MKFFSLQFFLFFILLSCSTQVKDTPTVHLKAGGYSFEVPEIAASEKVLAYNGFFVSYDRNKKVPRWTAYALTPNQALSKIVKRHDKFISDTQVDATLTEKDYRKSGYDKGHMVPADDMRWSQESMQDTFYMTNMAPQLHSLNAGIWRTLESKIKKWASQYDKIYVVTGPVLTKECLEKIANKICVPAEFYKVVLGQKGSQMLAIGFLIPHYFDKSKKYTDYAYSVKDVEKTVNINFFPQLSEAQSKSVEGSKNVENWL